MRKPTHDFLSDSTVHTDPMPSSQGEYLKTQDFLQPLERVGTKAYYVDATTSELKSAAHHVQNHQHVLPGGIGTYSISHIPQQLYHHHNQLQLVPKPENSNSNSSSGFTLWVESGGKKVNTINENVKERTNYIIDDANIRQWQGREQRSSFSSRSSSQTSDLKSHRQSFMDMIRYAKGSSLEDNDLDAEDEELATKKQKNICPRVDLRVKVDGKGHGKEQKPNTPRSKHSATEQRRRSKINDRFQMLRQLIPNSDQKRDKASFLLEVIEYIHYLQAKVDKHEVVPYQGKQHHPPEETTVRFLADTQAVDIDQQCLNRAIEEEEEELSVHRGTISISSVYSQGLLNTLTETLETSGVDLSKASISVQIKLSKQPLKDEEVHRKVRPRSQSEDENNNVDDNNNIKKLKKHELGKNIYNAETDQH